MTMIFVSVTAWFRGAFPVVVDASVFWLTVEKVVSVSVNANLKGEGVALGSEMPWDGGTTMVLNLMLLAAVNVVVCSMRELVDGHQDEAESTE